MDPHSFTVYDVFRRNARLYGGRVALKEGGRGVTFGELLGQAQALAGWLSSRRIGRGERIAVLTKNRGEFFPLFGAAAARGAILVPVNFRLTPAEMEYVLRDTSPSLLFFEPDYEETLLEIAGRCPFLREKVVFGRGIGAIPFGELLGHEPLADAEAARGEGAVIIHTAAIEGRPRGALLTHGNLLACSLQARAVTGLSEREVYLNILPLFHIGGIMASLATMHAGGRNVLISKFEAEQAGPLIDEEGVTFIGSFPPILSRLLDARRAGGCTLETLRHCLGIETAETIARFEALGGRRFWLIYGQTETAGLTCLAAAEERPGSAGRPGPLADLMVADEEGREMPRGQVGEILVRGPLVFSGYWGDEELTGRTFRGGWHHTGDLGRLDEEGFLFFAGRKPDKDLIKTGGENVYPAEVEKVLLGHPAVAEVVVLGVPDAKFGEAVKAVCVLREGAAVSEGEIIEFVARRIARYKKPSRVEFVPSLPRRPDGGVDRAKARELYGA